MILDSDSSKKGKNLKWTPFENGQRCYVMIFFLQPIRVVWNTVADMAINNSVVPNNSAVSVYVMDLYFIGTKTNT